MNGRRIQGHAHVHRRIQGHVACVVRVGNSRSSPWLVAELVRAVSVPKLQDCPRRDVPNPDRRRGVGCHVVGIMAEAAHQRIEDALPVAWEEVDRRPVGGEADRGFPVRLRAFPMRAAERCAEPRSESAPVVGGPRVVNARVDDGKCPRDHWRAERDKIGGELACFLAASDGEGDGAADAVNL